MDTRDVSIATMTLARDAHEEAVLRASLTELAQYEMPVAVTDSGSSAEFVDFLRGLWRFDVTELEPPGSLVRQVQQSVTTASRFDTEFILYAEPDKREFFRSHLAGFLARAPAHSDVGIVVAARTADAMATFPESQQRAETVFNGVCADVIGLATDYCYGPLLIRRSLARYIHAIDPSTGWGWRPFILALAKRLQYHLVAVEGDYRCPFDQRHDSEVESSHRLSQLTQNISGLIRSAECHGLSLAARI